MGYKTKVQLIKRANSESWYVSFPTQLAQALELEKSETVEWIVEDKMTITMKRFPSNTDKVKKLCEQGHDRDRRLNNHFGERHALMYGFHMSKLALFVVATKPACFLRGGAL